MLSIVFVVANTMNMLGKSGEKTLCLWACPKESLLCLLQLSVLQSVT